MILFHWLDWVSSILYLIDFIDFIHCPRDLQHVQIYGHLFWKYLRNLHCQLQEVVQWMFLVENNNSQGTVSTTEPPALFFLQEFPDVHAVHIKFSKMLPNLPLAYRPVFRSS